MLLLIGVYYFCSLCIFFHCCKESVLHWVSFRLIIKKELNHLRSLHFYCMNIFCISPHCIYVIETIVIFTSALKLFNTLLGSLAFKIISLLTHLKTLIFPPEDMEPIPIVSESFSGWLQNKCYVFMWQEALKNSEDKMARLKQQWEAHRQPLEEQLSQLNLEVNKKKVWMWYYRGI